MMRVHKNARKPNSIARDDHATECNPKSGSIENKNARQRPGLES